MFFLWWRELFVGVWNRVMEKVICEGRIVRLVFERVRLDSF